MRHRIRVLKARILAGIGFSRLVLAIVRGRVDEVWVGDSNAVMFGSDRFPRFSIGSTERGRWVWPLGPRLMFSVARDGYPPTLHRMLRILRHVRANRDVLWIFSAGEIDIRCHLVPRLKNGAELTFVKPYIGRVQALVGEFDARYAAVSVPIPPAVDIYDVEGFPIVGTLEERHDAHRLMRQTMLDETGPATGSTGAVIVAFDPTDCLSDEHGHYRPELTYDGMHPNDTGRVQIHAAIAELRSKVFSGTYE
jgi:hypothetical protein